MQFLKGSAVKIGLCTIMQHALISLSLVLNFPNIERKKRYMCIALS
ncbi:hypothetical protein PLEI_0210 [Photobacterium leiognathi lrivu.4.1]|uniref:Uncharacterized protein n=1 Tax=Photobacterium leiognathi lrivu.4.1 TaxID=1248232 RepID=V5EML3_PHOLE|nr:hypothetical protein PLEI_0210 [Photobacterium leiognathi lrivu.4.1]